MKPRLTAASLLGMLVFLLAGCSLFSGPVRHLSSDACLMSQGTTKQEVLAYMGQPNERQMDRNAEIWIYYQVNKSLLRKTPFIGDQLGTADVDVVTIRFEEDKIIACAYHSLTPEEFKKSGMVSRDKPDVQ